MTYLPEIEMIGLMYEHFNSLSLCSLDHRRAVIDRDTGYGSLYKSDQGGKNFGRDGQLICISGLSIPY